MARKSDGKVVYDESVLLMGIKLYESCEVPLDILYHLLQSKRLQSFSGIILQSESEAFGEFLSAEKRKTDLLISIEEERGLFAMLCQETQVDGGFYFLKRLSRALEERGSKERITAAIIGVESTKYSVRDLSFFMLDSFLKAKSEEESGIVFRTIR